MDKSKVEEQDGEQELPPIPEVHYAQGIGMFCVAQEVEDHISALQLKLAHALRENKDKSVDSLSPSEPKECQSVPSGEWVQPVVDGYRMQCCDCGLVHRMDFRVEDGRAQFRAFREPPTIPNVEERKESRRVTFSGKNWLEWHEHIDSLFAEASPGEDIPFNAIFAWQGTPDSEDVAWAEDVIRYAAPVAKVGSPSEEGTGEI